MKRVLLAAMTAALFSSPALAQDSDWTIGSRTLPAPAGASDDLRAAIAKTPQPDIAKHIMNSTFSTREEWDQFIRAANAGNTQRAEALAELWSVTIKEDNIAGVTVRTVTPAAIDPANENRLFVHVHGGAYVLNGGLAGLPEAILVASRAKISVMSIDYRMPPEHPFPAAVDDVVAVWKSLLRDRPAKSMALGGTSAGGGLTLASTLRFMELRVETPGADRKLPAVGNTVDVANATWTNTIGAPELITVWTDPEFDPSISAAYYARVLEIPTPRWTAYEAERFGITMKPDVPMVTVERAYTSPIWYTP